MEDFLDDAANVSVLFGIVESTQLDGALASARVRLEDTSLSLALSLLLHYPNEWHRKDGRGRAGK